MGITTIRTVFGSDHRRSPSLCRLPPPPPAQTPSTGVAGYNKGDETALSLRRRISGGLLDGFPVFERSAMLATAAAIYLFLRPFEDRSGALFLFASRIPFVRPRGMVILGAPPPPLAPTAGSWTSLSASWPNLFIFLSFFPCNDGFRRRTGGLRLMMLMKVDVRPYVLVHT